VQQFLEDFIENHPKQKFQLLSKQYGSLVNNNQYLIDFLNYIPYI